MLPLLAQGARGAALHFLGYLEASGAIEHGEPVDTVVAQLEADPLAFLTRLCVTSETLVGPLVRLQQRAATWLSEPAERGRVEASLGPLTTQASPNYAQIAHDLFLPLEALLTGARRVLPALPRSWQVELVRSAAESELARLEQLPFHYIWTLCDLARLETEIDPGRARTHLVLIQSRLERQVWNPQHRDKFIAEIAHLQACLGMVAEARATTQGLSHDYSRVDSLCDIALQVTEQESVLGAEIFAEAHRVASKIGDALYCILALTRLAYFWHRSDPRAADQLIAEARASLSRITEPGELELANTVIASVVEKPQPDDAGERPQATQEWARAELLAGFPEAERQSILWEMGLKEQARGGDLLGAYEAVAQSDRAAYVRIPLFMALIREFLGLHA